MDSDPDQKVAQRNQEILYNEGLKWIKKLASQGGGLGMIFSLVFIFLIDYVYLILI